MTITTVAPKVFLKEKNYRKYVRRVQNRRNRFINGARAALNLQPGEPIPAATFERLFDVVERTLPFPRLSTKATPLTKVTKGLSICVENVVSAINRCDDGGYDGVTIERNELKEMLSDFVELRDASQRQELKVYGRVGADAPDSE